MKWTNSIAVGVAAAAFGVSGIAAGSAQDVAVIAIPSHPDVPVIIDGRDATFRVVTGDWGLARPGAVPVVVYGPPAELPSDTRGYYPVNGHRPGYGRREHEPRVPHRPRPGTYYYRDWTASPAYEPPIPDQPYLPPQVLVAPRRK